MKRTAPCTDELDKEQVQAIDTDKVGEGKSRLAGQGSKANSNYQVEGEIKVIAKQIDREWKSNHPPWYTGMGTKAIGTK